MPVVAIIIILVVGTASFVNTILCHKLACHTTGLEPTSSYGMFVNRPPGLKRQTFGGYGRQNILQAS